MGEFRTQAFGSEQKDEGNLSVDKLLDQFMRNVKQSPEAQVSLYKTLEKTDLDPDLITLLVPEAGENLRKLKEQAQKQQEAQQQAQEAEGEIQRPEAELSVDNILDAVDDIIDIHGKDAEIGDVREWMDENRDIIKNYL